MKGVSKVIDPLLVHVFCEFDNLKSESSWKVNKENSCEKKEISQQMRVFEEIFALLLLF
jgi:hypothetical protein